MSNPIQRHKSYAVIRPTRRAFGAEHHRLDGSTFAATATLRSEMPGNARPSGRRHFGKTKCPFYWCKINDLHIGVDAGRAGGHHSPPPGAAHLPRRTASNARAPSDDFLFGQKILCSRNQNSLFPDGTGKWLQAIEFAWRPAPKTAPQGPHRTKFPKIRCYFPSSQGMRGSGRIKLSTPPSHPDD